MKDTKEESENSSYKSIVKATSLLGGVQVGKILINVAKQKIIALLLGTEGMGISGLLTSSTQLIQSTTSLGLSSSAVRNVAEAYASNDRNSLSRTVSALRNLVWGTGMLGMLCVILFSPLLSKSAFGNNEYIVPFIFLSVSLLFQQLSAGQSVLLQGMRKLRNLAEANVLGALLGLVLSIPIYFLFGIQGIVPTLILESLVILCCTWFFTRKIKFKKSTLSFKETLSEGKSMMGMGLAMTLNNILVLGVSYLVRVFIVNIGGLSDVGIYTAGITIVNSYVGLVFWAMGTDYYPRLAGINQDNEKCINLINQQSEIATIIIAPLASIFLVCTPIMIKILYSSDFLSMTTLMELSMIGMIFKASSWAISYLFLAKADMKAFLFNEVVIQLISVPVYIGSYKIAGLDGLGLGFLIIYILYFLIVYISAQKKYNFHFSKSYKMLFFICLVIILSIFIINKFTEGYYSLAAKAILIFSIIFYSFKQLDSRVGVTSFLRKSLKK